jgi:hypothetical protein
MEANLRQVDVRRLLVEKSLATLRGRLSSFNNDLRVAQVGDWPQARSSAKCILQIAMAVDALYPENVPKRSRIPGMSAHALATSPQAIMLSELKTAVAMRASVCNDKIAVITAIIGSSTRSEELQIIGTSLQKLDVDLGETSRMEVRESMTSEELEADLVLIRAQVDAMNDFVAPPDARSTLLLPAAPATTNSTPNDVLPPRAEPTTASSPRLKKDASSGSRVGMFFKKYMGGDKDKKKGSREDIDLQSTKAPSPTPASSQTQASSSHTSPPTSGKSKSGSGGLEGSPREIDLAVSSGSQSSVLSGQSDPQYGEGSGSATEKAPASTPISKIERRREQSRSWDDASARPSDAYFQPSSHSSVTMVTITIDPLATEAVADSNSNITSPSSSARSSAQSQPVNVADGSSANNSASATSTDNPSTKDSRPTSIDSQSLASPPLSPSTHRTAAPASGTTQPTSLHNSGTVAISNATNVVEPISIPTAADPDSGSPAGSTTPKSHQATNSNDTFTPNNSRARRRAAVFQKQSALGDMAGSSGATVPALDEQTALEEAVNIWDEPKENHIIYEKPIAAPAGAGAAAGGPSNPQPGGGGAADRTTGDRETVVLGGSADEPSSASSSSANANGAIEEVVAGTLNQLVKHLTSSKGVDGRALQTFLLTYTSFTTPKMLLEKLIQRYNTPKHKLEPRGASSKTAKDIEAACRQRHLRVINFLRKWLDLCFVDFTEELIEMVFSFCERLRQEGSASLATLIDNALLSKLAGLAKRKMTQFMQPPPPPIFPKIAKDATPRALELMDLDPVELARQITLIDYELFGQIRPSELLNLSWNKPKLKHRSPHVLEMIQRFNTLSKWLCGQILHTEALKDRIKVMQHIVKLGKALLALNNFNALNAVLSAIQNSAVYRLSQTKEGMGSKYLKLIEEWTTLMAPRQNSANYKAALAAAKPPAVPYLGHYLSALTFIEEGNPPRLYELINFKKCRLISKVIVGLLQYQVGTRYNLVPIDSIKELIANLGPTESDDELYELSLVREPRVPVQTQ